MNGTGVRRIIGALAGVMVLASSAAACGTGGTGHKQAAAPVKVELAEHRIPSGDAGIELYAREKRPAGKARFGATETVVFVEPFGVPTAEAFDVPGLSWMDDLARRGYDTWALDVRGFGRSTRPAAMTQPPLQNPPLVSTDDAVRDLDATVAFIAEHRGARRVSIVGWSWGGVVAGAYAGRHPERVERLVLYGAMHGFALPSMTQPLESAPGTLKQLPAYQLAAFDATTLGHWNMMMAGRPLATPEAIAAVRKVFDASDPTSATRQPVSIRRAMGPMVDLYSIWSDRPIFDAAAIAAPTLVIRGDADFFADPTLAAKLTRSTARREVVVEGATHWMLYERTRARLLSETATFLRA